MFSSASGPQTYNLPPAGMPPGGPPPGSKYNIYVYIYVLLL